MKTRLSYLALPILFFLFFSFPRIAFSKSETNSTQKVSSEKTPDLYSIFRAKTDLISDSELVFEGSGIEFYRNRLKNLTYTFHRLPANTEEARILTNEDLSERVKFYNFFKLQQILLVSSLKKDSIYFHILKYQFSKLEKYAIEIHEHLSSDHYVHTFNFDNKEDSLKAWEQIIKASVNAKEDSVSIAGLDLQRLPSSEAAAGCEDCQKGTSLFQEQIRSIMTPIQDSLKAKCEAPKTTTKNPNAEAIGQSLLSCLRGVTASVTDLISFAYELCNFAFKEIFNSEYRAKTFSGVGSVLSSVWSDPAGFISKIFSSVWSAVEKEYENIKTCSAQYRAQVACKVLTDLIGLRGLYKLGKKAIAPKSAKALATDTEKIASELIEKNAKESIPAGNKSGSQEQVVSMNESKIRSAIVADAEQVQSLRNKSFSGRAKKIVKNKASREYFANQQILSEKVRKSKIIAEQLQKIEYDLIEAEFRNAYRKVKTLTNKKTNLQIAKKALEKEIDQTSNQMRATLEKQMKKAGIKFRRLTAESEITKEYKDLRDYLGIKIDIANTSERVRKLENFAAPQYIIDIENAKIRHAQANLEKIFAKYKDADKHQLQRQALQSIEGLSEAQLQVMPLQSIGRFEGGYQLLHLPDAPKVIDGIDRRFGTKVLIRDPVQQVHSGSNGTFYRWSDVKNEISLNPESFLNYDGVKNTSLMHEVRHNYLEDLRSHKGGSPYDAWVYPSQSEVLDTALEKSSSYKHGFTLEELSAFEKDANLRSSKKILSEINLGKQGSTSEEVLRIGMRESMLTASENNLAKAYEAIKVELQQMKTGKIDSAKPKSYQLVPSKGSSKQPWTVQIITGEGSKVEILPAGDLKNMSGTELADAILKKLEESQVQTYIHRVNLEETKLRLQDVSESIYKRHVRGIIREMMED